MSDHQSKFHWDLSPKVLDNFLRSLVGDKEAVALKLMAPEGDDAFIRDLLKGEAAKVMFARPDPSIKELRDRARDLLMNMDWQDGINERARFHELRRAAYSEEQSRRGSNKKRDPVIEAEVIADDDPLLKYLLADKLTEAEFSGPEITEAAAEVTLLMSIDAVRSLESPLLDKKQLLAREIQRYRQMQIENRAITFQAKQRERGKKSADKRRGKKRPGTRRLRVQVKRWWKYYHDEDERERAALIHWKLGRSIDIQTVRKIIRELRLRKANR